MSGAAQLRAALAVKQGQPAPKRARSVHAPLPFVTTSGVRVAQDGKPYTIIYVWPA